LWRKYIAWERSNPLKLDDPNQVSARVIYAYKQALLMLRFYPQMWYEASTYLSEVGKGDEALAMLKQGAEVVSTSLLLNLQLAELCESRGQLEDAKDIFEALVTKLEEELTLLDSSLDVEKKRTLTDLHASDAAADLENSVSVQDGEERERRRQRDKLAMDKIDLKRINVMNPKKRALSLVWIFYMRFCRRAENVKAARAVFARARKSPFCMSHVFVASALMEHYISKDPAVAGRVFELGLKTLATNTSEDRTETEEDELVTYILEYLDWLMNQNDENSTYILLKLRRFLDTRALFERALSTIPAHKARPIWDKFLHYEQQYGDLTTLFRVEKRRREAFPEDAFRQSGLEHVAQRYSYLDLDYVGKHEMGLNALRNYAKKHGKKDLGPGKLKITKGSAKPNLRNFVLFNPEDAPNLPPPPMNPVAPVQLHVPDGIARLLTMLPSSSQFRGPILPSEDLVSLLVSLPQIPLPIIQPPLVPIPSAHNKVMATPSSGALFPPLHGSLPVLRPPPGMMQGLPQQARDKRGAKRGRPEDGAARKRMRDF
jgi:hypothetical protein